MRRPSPVKANVVASDQQAWSHPSARLPFALFVSRAIRLGACWGPVSSGAAISPRSWRTRDRPRPRLIKHSNAVART